MKKINIISGTIVLLVFLGIFFFFKNINKPILMPATRNSLPKNNVSANNQNQDAISLMSSAFQDGQPLPAKYTCDGAGMNPPLSIDNIPANAKTLAIILEDPDATGGTFTHWILYNLDPTIKNIPENSSGGAQGENDFGNPGYGAPCPVQNSGVHHYTFKVLALDEEIDFPSGTIVRRSDFDNGINGHVVGSGQLIGTYSK
jgi:Raf kinase inhibitor-like YbhB/YbcL family protein